MILTESLKDEAIVTVVFGCNSPEKVNYCNFHSRSCRRVNLPPGEGDANILCRGLSAIHNSKEVQVIPVGFVSALLVLEGLTAAFLKPSSRHHRGGPCPVQGRNRCSGTWERAHIWLHHQESPLIGSIFFWTITSPWGKSNKAKWSALEGVGVDEKGVSHRSPWMRTWVIYIWNHSPEGPFHLLLLGDCFQAAVIGMKSECIS